MKLAAIPLFVLLALATGCQAFRSAGSGVRSFGTNLSDFITKAPRDAAVQMEDTVFADERRQGINRLSSRDFGRKAPYTDRYQQIVQTEEDWLVKATAIRALNRSRDQSAAPLFIKSLDDKNEVVKLEAIKALNNVPDAKAAAPLLKILLDEAQARDVRIAAAEALRHYRSLEVGRTLVNLLGEREFAVAWQARQSLISITGTDYKYDEAAWLSFLTGPGKPLG